ncbi:hypothetical protein, partial [Acinetobacter baumannii]|uniref:hypothetical protein n=1 Tax=Acinetobacter baumannii TaxID=470 RepID=UPI00113039E6
MDINKPDLPKAEGLFDRIIQFSINNAIWVMMFVIAWIGVGIYSYQKLSIDASCTIKAVVAKPITI